MRPLELEGSKMSRYAFTEMLPPMRGFRIDGGEERCPVEVRLQRYCLTFRSVPGSPVYLGFYDFYRLMGHIGGGLMSEWRPPGKSWPGLRSWAIQQTQKCLCKRVHERWKNSLAQVEPDVVAVHRAIFAATFGSAVLAMQPELYMDKYVVKDIVNHRAAAVAATEVYKLLEGSAEARITSSESAKQLQALADKMGVQLSISVTQNLADRQNSIDAWMSGMQNWRGLFSPTGQDYRSLNRTLMNLPGGIPSSLFCGLQLIELPRPILKRLELLAVLLFVGDIPGNRLHPNFGVIIHARDAQIKEAMRRVSEYIGQSLSTRKVMHVRRFVEFVRDFPDAHNGNIVGLADKSIHWHRDEQEREVMKQLDHLGGDTETAKPPIALPGLPEVTFLDTVESVCREGVDMNHCIASYAKRAVSGNCYLFHIEHRGEGATVEVDWSGRVAQAHGPHNQSNVAVRWGRRVLNRWGDGFPQDRPMPRPNQDIPL